VHHKVAPGETLIAIARRFAIDVEDVARDNDVGINDALRPGTGLRLRVLPRDVVPRAPTPSR
jgi:membrane-bound lytic murein transglycosylase D